MKVSQFSGHIMAAQYLLATAAMHHDKGDIGDAADSLNDALRDLLVSARSLADSGVRPVNAIGLAERLRMVADVLDGGGYGRKAAE